MFFNKGLRIPPSPIPSPCDWFPWKETNVSVGGSARQDHNRAVMYWDVSSALKCTPAPLCLHRATTVSAMTRHELNLWYTHTIVS